MRENAQDIEGRTLLIIYTHYKEQTAARKWWVFPLQFEYYPETFAFLALLFLYLSAVSFI